MELPSISVQIICKNEERVIARCLQAISTQVTEKDEIVVVDTGSTDKTKEIIMDHFPKVKLFNYKWEDDFAKARNNAIGKSEKDWIFFIDSDEVLQPKSLDNLRDSIIKVETVSDKPIVFCPKVLNDNDTIVYNAGRVIKNNGDFEFYGCVHEYPIYLKELSGTNYITLRLTNVVMLHDGYSDEVIVNKNKAIRNSTLDKKMLNEFPDSDRYSYFYYRDAKPILSKEQYENGMKEFFSLHPESHFLTQAYPDFIAFLISNLRTDEAEEYLERYWSIIKSKPGNSTVDVVRLSALNELQKICVIQQDLVRILLNAKDELLNDENRTLENGYVIDDIIGFLYWSLGEIAVSKKMYRTLKKKGYLGMLDKLFAQK